MSCIACKKETKKYKCPTCSEPYCSLQCYKLHQQQECQPKEPLSMAEALGLSEADLEPTIHVFRTEDTVPDEKLEQLKNSEGLRNLLYNPHLRSLLREIDVAPNASAAMNAAMQEPLFIEFADECLKVIEPDTDID